jgi:hypothetical protein
VIEEDGEETSYAVGETTDAFVRHASGLLLGFERLRANVRYFKTPFLPTGVQTKQVLIRGLSLLRNGDAGGCFELLRRPGYSPEVTQHPDFQGLYARACAELQQPKYEDASVSSLK